MVPYEACKTHAKKRPKETKISPDKFHSNTFFIQIIGERLRKFDLRKLGRLFSRLANTDDINLTAIVTHLMAGWPDEASDAISWGNSHQTGDLK